MNASILELEVWAAYHWVFKDYTFMDGFKSRDIGLRAQKKIFSKMANKNVAKVFIDETSSRILDNFYKLLKNVTGNKKEAEKVVKNVIKIVIKLAVLHRHNQLTKEDLVLAEKFKNKFNASALAIISFYEVDFSYDRTFLMKHLIECKAALSAIVQRHLTEKSVQRIDHVFGIINDPQFLDAVFRRNSQHQELLGLIVNDMSKAMDAGEL